MSQDDGGDLQFLFLNFWLYCIYKILRLYSAFFSDFLATQPLPPPFWNFCRLRYLITPPSFFKLWRHWWYLYMLEGGTNILYICICSAKSKPIYIKLTLMNQWHQIYIIQVYCLFWDIWFKKKILYLNKPLRTFYVYQQTFGLRLNSILLLLYLIVIEQFVAE